MLNDIWNGLVNEVEAAKEHCDNLEGSMIQANDCLNNEISALIERVDKLEGKFCTIHNWYEDLWVKFNSQQHTIYSMDKRISFYSQSIVKLENKKVQAMDCQLEELEHFVTSQDDQLKVLQACLTVAERGHCCCGEETPKVISCCCFLILWKLTEDAQELGVTMETGGLEYEDEEVEAFRCSLIV